MTKGIAKSAFAVGFGTMVVAFHAAAVSASLPVIMAQCHLGLTQAQLILTLYSFVIACCLIVSGRLGDIIGFKPVFVAGLVTIGVASLGICIPNSMPFILPLRMIEGVGAAMISGTSLALVAAETESNCTGRQIGWQTSLTYIGLAAGSLFAIPMAQRLGWQVVFAANAVLSIAAIVIAVVFLNPESNLRTHGRIAISRQQVWSCIIGLVVFALLVSQLQFKPAVFLCNLAVLTGTSALLVANSRKLTAEGDGQAPALWGVNAAELNCYLCVYGVSFLMPLYLITQLRVGAVTAGLLLCCQYLGRSFAAVLSGTLIETCGTSILIFFGSTLMSLALLSLSFLDFQTPILRIAVLLLLFGAGTGLFVPANSTVAVRLIHKSQRGIGAGILATFRNAGMTLGVPFAAFVFNTFYAPAHGPFQSGALGGAMAVLFGFSMITVCISLRSTTRERLLGITPSRMLRSMEDL